MIGGGTPKTLPSDANPVVAEFFSYYGTPLGYHPRATLGFDLVSMAWMAEFWSFDKLLWNSSLPVLLIAGRKAHTRFFSEQAYAHATEPRELFPAPGAEHVDLCHLVTLIPFDKLEGFFTQHLA